MIKIEVTSDELELVCEALDSHRYWQLSSPVYRNSGYVLEPGSDDPDISAQIVETEKLEDRLRAVLQSA